MHDIEIVTSTTSNLLVQVILHLNAKGLLTAGELQGMASAVLANLEGNPDQPKARDYLLYIFPDLRL